MTGASSTFLASDPDAYERLMGRWSRRLAPKFLNFTGVDSGDPVLEVGCGTGSLTETLAARPSIRSIFAVDISPDYVARVRSRLAGERVRVEVSDACALAVPDASVDHALSMLVLQFVPRAGEAVAELCRVTRPGGTVAAATWDARGGMVWSRMFWDTAAAIDPKAVELRAGAFTRPMSLPGDLERAWSAVGLKNVEQSEIAIRMDYASFDDFWTPLEGKDGPYTRYIHSLPADAYATLKEKVRLAYVDGSPDGPRSYASTALVVKGQRP